MTVTGAGRHPGPVTEDKQADPAIAVQELLGTLGSALRSASPRGLAALRDVIEVALETGGYGAERLAELTAGDRCDFLTSDGIVIDLFPVTDNAAAVHRRIMRHAAYPPVSGVVAVITGRRQNADLPGEASGKPVAITLAHGRAR